MSKIPNIEEMLKAGMHFGHRTSKWHPKMAPYIFGKRNGVHIIDLLQSRQLLEEALNYMQKLREDGKTILFVGTKMQVKGPLKKMTAEIGAPSVTEKWMGGTLTNFMIVRKLIKKYKDLQADQKSGMLSKYTKKEQLDFTKEIAKLELKVGGMSDLMKLPDALFIWDIKVEKTALLEARKKNIPVIAICDTNTNPTGVNYPIPSNDDATKTIKLLLDTIKTSIQSVKVAKKEA